MSKIFSPQTLMWFPVLGMGPQCHGVHEATSILVQLASLTQVLGEPSSVHVLGCLMTGTGQNWTDVKDNSQRAWRDSGGKFRGGQWKLTEWSTMESSPLPVDYSWVLRGRCDRLR